MNSVIRITSRLSTPPTASLLGSILALYVLGCVCAFGVQFPGATVAVVNTVLCFGVFWVCFSPATGASCVLSWICFSLTTRFGSSSFAIGLLPAPTGFLNSFGMFFSPFAASYTSTRFANTMQAEFSHLVFRKVFSRSRKLFAAFCAAFCRGIHSVPLSLYLKWVSADGEIDRRFALQSLADKRNYTINRPIKRNEGNNHATL